MLRSGMLNVRQLLDDGVRVSLGTDVSGGASPSMLEAIREAVRAVASPTVPSAPSQMREALSGSAACAGHRDGAGTNL